MGFLIVVIALTSVVLGLFASTAGAAAVAASLSALAARTAPPPRPRILRSSRL